LAFTSEKAPWLQSRTQKQDIERKICSKESQQILSVIVDAKYPVRRRILRTPVCPENNCKFTLAPVPGLKPCLKP
jgi:hypothetical protein